MQPLPAGFVRIIHPETQGVAEVPESSLGQHYRAGWALLDESNMPQPDPEPDPPKPARAKADKAAKSTPAGDGQGDAADTGSEG